MKTVGLIVEYNPFHNGHLYHLQKSKEMTSSDAVVAVMSGNFLQRGEPALLDKWARAEMALANGCDLVIELPAAYATQAAEWFAFGAVSLLQATGVVDSFCFGTESGNIKPLETAARIVANEPEDFKALLQQLLQAGASYPNAYSSAIKQYLLHCGDLDAAQFSFDMPNHTLGLHYLTALRRINGTMKPYTIAREKSQYNDTSAQDGTIASATAIRKMLLEQQDLQAIKGYIPEATFQIIEKHWRNRHCPMDWERFRSQLLHKLLTTPIHELASIHEITEGLEYRIHHMLQANTFSTVEEMLSALKTKRYTRTKLQRALLAILLGHRKKDFEAKRLAEGVTYIRVLGFTEKGRSLLRRMRKEATLPVLMSAARPKQLTDFLELDIRASHVYELAKPASEARIQLYRDYREKPIIAP